VSYFEERPGFPGARRALGGVGGHVGAPHLVMSGLLAYALTLEALGYVPTTFLLLGALARILGLARWPLVLGFAALATVGSWALFGLWLGVPLPSGVFGR